MIGDLRELYRYRDLLFSIFLRDVKVKYKQSVMGFLWAIFMPMLIVCAGVLVKYGLSIVSGKPFESSQIITVSVKALPWSFFVASIRFATLSLTGNSNLVTKIYFPKEVLPIAAVASSLFDLFVASIALTVLLVVAGVGLNTNILWVPLLLVILSVFCLGLSLGLAALNLFFRDVKYIVEVVLTFAIFFTPVFYEVDMFGQWRTLLLLNPVAPVLEGLNTVIVSQTGPELLWIGYSAVVSIAVCFGAYWYFKRVEPAFAENM